MNAITWGDSVMPADTKLFTNFNIIDGSGSDSFLGEMLVKGNRIDHVGPIGSSTVLQATDIIDGHEKILMPGLCDAHLHLTWNDQATLEGVTMMPPEEHLVHSIGVAKKVLDSGFTSGVGAASARPRFDCVLRNAINDGHIVGPRYLANTQEITTIGGLGDTSPVHIDIDDLSFGARISGPEEMRKMVRKYFKFGVDLVKLNLSGEEITSVPAQHTTMSDEEVGMAMSEVRRQGIRACAHARSTGSVLQCIDHGIEIIYHASYADEECLDKLEEQKDRFFVAPALGWLVQTAYGAGEFGIAPESKLACAYASELEIAVETMKKMHSRGIRILPGGDYGFAWTPHGTNAKDLEYLTTMVGMTPMEAIVAATKLGGEIMGHPEALGLLKKGFFADLLVLNGNPLEDISMLQNKEKILVIMKDGKFHKNIMSQLV
jgi:imidazolonepropionase-like amidohydrolase